MGLFSKTPETGVVSQSPRIEIIDDFATPEECSHVIELARGDMDGASIINAEGESVENNLRRTADIGWVYTCLLYTSPSPRDATLSRMPSSA